MCTCLYGCDLSRLLAPLLANGTMDYTLLVLRPYAVLGSGNATAKLALRGFGWPLSLPKRKAARQGCGSLSHGMHPPCCCTDAIYRVIIPDLCSEGTRAYAALFRAVPTRCSLREHKLQGCSLLHSCSTKKAACIAASRLFSLETRGHAPLFHVLDYFFSNCSTNFLSSSTCCFSSSFSAFNSFMASTNTGTTEPYSTL